MENSTADVTISHSAGEGTLLTGDPRPHQQLVKDAGFRWSGRQRFWYVPNSRDRLPWTDRINGLADRLRAAGLTVAVEIDLAHRSTAEAEADRAERIEDRQEALEAKSEKLAGERDRRWEASRQISEVIPFGQPILIGHHSERRHRRDLERMRTNDAKGMEAHKASEEAARKARASESNQRHRESPGTTLRRIEKKEAEVRDIDRKLAGRPCPTSGRNLKADAEPRQTMHCPYCGQDVEMVDGRQIPVHYAAHDGPASGEWKERLDAVRARLVDEIAYWRAHLATLEEGGVKLWGPDDFKPGDLVQGWMGWAKVIRVNKKTLTVPSGYSWTLKLPYSEVKGRRDRPDFTKMGAEAFAAGAPRCVPITVLCGERLEGEVGEHLPEAKEWLAGWDAANLAAPVEGVEVAG